MTVFSLDPTSGRETVIYSFDNNGGDAFEPQGRLIDVGGTLYGLTVNGDGALYSIAPGTGTETVLHSFDGSDGETPVGALLDVKGTLYGATAFGGPGNSGVIFSYATRTGTEAVVYAFCSQQSCKDGAFPFGDLIEAKGSLYGTTNSGGANDEGTVFALMP